MSLCLFAPSRGQPLCFSLLDINLQNLEIFKSGLNWATYITYIIKFLIFYMGNFQISKPDFFL